MRQIETEEHLAHGGATVIAASVIAVAAGKPVWHQELFDQALSIFHGASPAITAPATYEYVAAIGWMWAHHEAPHNISLTAIDNMSPEVAAWAHHPDLTIFENVPVQLIGQIGF